MTAEVGELGQRTSLGHWQHPLLGARVIDGAHGDIVGVLRAVAPDLGKGVRSDFDGNALPGRSAMEAAEPVAWLSPERGGREWPTPLEYIRPAV